MKIEVDVTPDDYGRFWLAAAFLIQKPYRTPHAGFFRVILVLAIAVGLTLGFMGFEGYFHLPSVLVTLLVVFGLHTALIIWTVRWVKRQNAHGLNFGHLSYEFTDEGIQHSSDQHVIFCRWSVISSIVMTKEHIGLIADSTFAFVIPKRDIPVDELTEFILSRIDQYDVDVTS